MNKYHEKILRQIFGKPDRSDISWEDFMALLTSLNADIKTKSGSAVGVKLNGIYAVFHKPHPGKTIYRSDIKRIRRFLVNAGIRKGT